MVSLLCIRREPFSQFGKEGPLLVFRCSRHFCSLFFYILKRKDWKSFCGKLFFSFRQFSRRKKGGFFVLFQEWLDLFSKDILRNTPKYCRVDFLFVLYYCNTFLWRNPFHLPLWRNFSSEKILFLFFLLYIPGTIKIQTLLFYQFPK